MTETLITSHTNWLSRISRKPAVSLAKKIIFKLLDKLETGRITLCDGVSRQTFGTTTPDFSLSATLTIHNPKAYTLITFGGSIGAAEAYMMKFWDVDDLTVLVRIVIRNQNVFRDMESGLARLVTPFYNVFHFLRRNTVSGSRKNIVAHYDLGNDFYRLFLDDTMTYSNGIFERPEATLEEAAIAKYDRICRKLHLTEKDHVLEIGTGWGGFALYAVRRYGCRVTTTTISDEQYVMAKQRFERAGVQNKVTLLKSDYRVLQGQFDKLVSIEMVEAVGHQYLRTYMERCAGLLKSDGIMVIQAITIADWAYENHKKSVDFIKQYIFPGSCIPSVTAISDAAAGATDLRLFNLEDITPHYATTLRMWRRRFLGHLDQVAGLGFSERFARMWEYYLRYCEAGFKERYLGSVQLVFTKPLTRMPVTGWPD
ncbi:MAG: class I SAM-dependent methyltransferase [Desulfobacteraceae bacterium]|nr:class I SAM-dependent methyltransferase [Desulfobacteraceae bacterium]